jgi:hypothetical protein
MQNGTVTIPVEEYNNLRDFKRTIEEEGSLLRKYGSYGIPMYQYYSKNESIQDLNEELKISTERCDNILAESETVHRDIAKKSIWQFLIWRKTYRS